MAARAAAGVDRLNALPAVLIQDGVLMYLPPPALFKLRRVCKPLLVLVEGALANVPGPVILGGKKQAWEPDHWEIGERFPFMSTVLQFSWTTLQWKPLPAMLTARCQPSAAALDDGTIVVVGGEMGGAEHWSAECLSAQVL